MTKLIHRAEAPPVWMQGEDYQHLPVQGPFFNPFYYHADWEEAREHYKRHLLHNVHLNNRLVREYGGRTIICHCNGRRCPGAVIQEILNWKPETAVW